MPRGTDLSLAADVLARGGVVAMPTETVYGLAASIAHPDAVARIFAIKGRPLGHPLIVHLAEADDLPRYATDLPAAAHRLAKAFWPGPLTLIVAKSPAVPDVVTGGHPTVGLRVPAHPMARALIAQVGPVAAPSANRFGAVSPTTAAHVEHDLGARVDYILDGGACEVGVESTVVEVHGDEATLLRPGGVSAAAIEACLGRPLRAPTATDAPAPGTLPSHYAPRAQVLAVTLADAAHAIAHAPKPVAVLGPATLVATLGPVAAHVVRVPDDDAGFARELYGRLRDLDATGVATIVAVLPPPTGLGAAIIDRLARAAAPRPFADSRTKEPT